MARAVNLGADRVLWMEGAARPRSASRKSPLLLSAILLFFLICGSLVYVWSRIQVIQVGYEISNAMKAGRGLVEENKRLRVEAATLKSYSRIEKIAAEELGMTKPGPGQVIVIR